MIAIVLAAVIAAASASMLNLTSEWRTDFGWEITCAWRLFPNDSLQSVRLMDHERQFLVYRPEISGSRYFQHFQLPEKLFQVDCSETSKRGVTGQCVMTLELYQPVVDDMRYACEVSGERPTFRVEKKDIEIAALVPPSDAVIEVARGSTESKLVLNCTSSGLPEPKLVWTIEDQKVPQDFYGKTWNMTSKLWNVWSLLSYDSKDFPANCTPVTNKGEQSFKGKSAEHYGADASAIKSTIYIIMALPILVLTR